MDDAQALARIADTLDELLAWTRLQGIENAKRVLETALPNPQQRLVYQASEGASSAKVATAVGGVSDVTIQRLWKRLYKLGLMKEDRSVAGRYIRTFDLNDFNLMVPAAEKNAKIESSQGATVESPKPKGKKQSQILDVPPSME